VIIARLLGDMLGGLNMVLPVPTPPELHHV
jgi:hypothetical protein